MKIDRRWVAGMAALLMAALMIATPREGAAWPIRFMYPDYPPGPVFGDPEEPSGAVPLRAEAPWFCFLRFRGWLLTSNSVATIPSTLRHRAAAPPGTRVTKHE